jgi:hypothetical protein
MHATAVRDTNHGYIRHEDSPCAASLGADFIRDLDSSESIPSEHSSVYDAARVSSALVEGGGNPAGYQLATCITVDNHQGYGQDPHAKRGAGLSVSDGLRYRNGISVDATESDFGTQPWLEDNLSPVLPAQPTHPPPVRSPTPPGLPSFGTVGVLRYSPNTGRSAGQSRTRRTSLRRIFGAPPTEPRSPQIPAPAVMRAQDGTVIQGQFPIRHSGHGVELTNHPFQGRTLTFAPEPSNLRQSTHVDENDKSEPVTSQPRLLSPERGCQTVGTGQRAASDRQMQGSCPTSDPSAAPASPSATVAGDERPNVRTEEDKMTVWAEMWRSFSYAICCRDERDDMESALGPGRNRRADAFLSSTGLNASYPDYHISDSIQLEERSSFRLR